MNYSSNMLVIMSMLAAFSVLRLATSKTIVVGGEIGWKIPPTDTTYSDWASNKTFTVGDVLEFNFITGGHTVAEVTKTAYDGCDTTSILSLHTDSPANINLSHTGEFFFFCSFIGHCDAGQKLAVNVTSDRPSFLPPSPAPAPSPRVSASSAAATSSTGSSSAILPDPLVAFLLIAATGLLLTSVFFI